MTIESKNSQRTSESLKEAISCIVILKEFIKASLTEEVTLEMTGEVSRGLKVRWFK